MSSAPIDRQPSAGLTPTQWLICFIAALGFAFDIYELLMMPLIQRPALTELLGVDGATKSGNDLILDWTSYILLASAISGGLFGLLGGYLTDLFGRRRILVWSILLYACSAFAAGFSTNVYMLLVLRCTTFIGVCVEFVAAVAWLAELFPDPKTRERVLGFTQAFSSLGGIMVTGAYYFLNKYQASLPEFLGPEPDVWRYTLMSGLIPALPLILIRPFLPESTAWQEKKAAGTLRRPSFGELFRPEFLRTTLVTAFMFACAYGAAFGAIQLTPQIVPGLIPDGPKLAQLQAAYETKTKELPADSPELAELKKQIVGLGKAREAAVSGVNAWQEYGGLTGRIVLAVLAGLAIGRRNLLRLFQIPGMFVVPLVFWFAARESIEILKAGIFVAGFCTVAQFSFWGNYLPRVYPTYLRGTGESFAANIGGRMFGTMAILITRSLAKSDTLAEMVGAGPSPFARMAVAAAIVGFLAYALGSIACYFLPEPKSEHLEE
jgi:MFS family permease